MLFRSGRTALLDAVYLSVSEMRNAHNAKRALLIISDGGDNNSRYNERDIRRSIREANTQLYAIGIFDPVGYRGRTPEELNGPSLLNELTDLTGGRAFDVTNASELADIAAKVGMELRNQYILGYHPSNKTHDARWRKIKVKVAHTQGTPTANRTCQTGLLCDCPLGCRVVAMLGDKSSTSGVIRTGSWELAFLGIRRLPLCAAPTKGNSTRKQRNPLSAISLSRTVREVRSTHSAKQPWDPRA